MPTNINTNYLSFSSLVSRAGDDARVLATGPIDFTVDTAYNIDLTATVQSANLTHPIQAVYIDCSTVAFGTTTLTVNGTGQNIRVPAGVQGYYPLLIASRNFVFTLTNISALNQSKGSATLLLYFVNVPMVAAEWITSAAAAGGAGSAMNGPVRSVTGSTVQATISDYTLLCDCTSNQVALYLPPNLNGFQTSILNVIKADATPNTVLVSGNGAAIKGVQNGSTFQLGVPYQGVTLQWTGGAWEIVASFNGGFAGGTAKLSLSTMQLRDTTPNGTHPNGAWWRMFADSFSTYGVTYGWEEVNSGLIAGGFDDAGNLYASHNLIAQSGFSVNPQQITFNPGWLSWTPAVVGGAMTVSAVTIAFATFLQIGPLCMVEAALSFTTGGTLAPSVAVSLPFAYKGASSLWVPISSFASTGIGSVVNGLASLATNSSILTVYAGSDSITNYTASAHSLFLRFAYRTA